MADDKLIFADEPQSPDSAILPGAFWKLLVVDDEEEVHRATRLVLQDFSFEGRGLEILCANSAEEGRQIMLDHPDIAVILLDVVMESNHAGLEMADWIRNELGNGFVRIVLRTGQPGQAPEQDVIQRYDINDYKQKSELTAQRLFTTMTTALRTYRDLRIIELNRLGLEQIVSASADLFQIQSVRRMARGILTQLTSLLGLRTDSLYVQTSGFAARTESNELRIMAGTGRYAACIDGPMNGCPVIPDEVAERINTTVESGSSKFMDNAYIGFFPSGSGLINLVYLEGAIPFGEDMDENLIAIFSNNVSIALDNIRLNREIVDTQREVVQRLGEVVENRSTESASHISRMAQYCRILAKESNLTDDDVEMLALATPLHDVGKIAIPDTILLKPGKLTADEFEVIKTHTTIGHDILKRSNRRVLNIAATIALQHHENWDGTGYPHGLSGEDIHIFGRITAVADVFDALCTKRVHKEAWEMDQVLDYFREQSGRKFDPELVNILFHKLEEFIAVLEDNSREDEIA